MEKMFTEEMLKKLKEAKESKGGYKYNMEAVSRAINMSTLCYSNFKIFGIPDTIGTIKKVRGSWYIYTQKKDNKGNTDERYKVNEAVSELLGLDL